MKAKRDFDILVAGEINPDLVLTGNVIPAFGQVEQLVDTASLSIGSSSAIFACGAARLGLRVAFLGICGDDHFGRFMLAEMRLRNVDVSSVVVDPAIQTGISIILSTANDRAILTYPGGSMDRVRSEQLTDDLLSRARHLHVASYFLQKALQPGLPDLLLRARSLGLSISMDPNWDPSGKWEGFKALLPLVDVFLPNGNEAVALTHSPTPEAALQALSRPRGWTAIKLGAQGAIGEHAGKTARAPARTVQVIDTTGAGDSFDAGFLYAFLNGWSLERALLLGVACGSLSTRQEGGTTAQPGLEEALDYAS